MELKRSDISQIRADADLVMRRCTSEMERTEVNTESEWVKRLGPEAARHRRNYIQSALAFAGVFFAVAIWTVIGYDVTTGADRNVVAVVTLAVCLACFTTVFSVQVHCKRVAVKSASAALNLDAHVGVKALPEPALRSMRYFDLWTSARQVAWVEPPS